MTTLELSAVEVANLPTEGTFWIVREGEPSVRYSDDRDGVTELRTTVPPPVFTQAGARASCECGGSRIDPLHRAVPDRQHLRRACPTCRIELVGPCPGCADDPDYSGEFALICTNCLGDFSVHVGWAYVVGQPLPICDYYDESAPEQCLAVAFRDPPAAALLPDGRVLGSQDLAHYGPPESLVGQYALELRQA